MDREARVYVAGHRGLVGSAIVRRLRRAGSVNLLTSDDITDMNHGAIFYECLVEVRRK